ncbi:MAG: sulfotransferase domain-containing protein [Desulfobacteraceae bacterium]|nr:sulfotransferase domain-containing protein [Desulfobacteraceae bacterium]MBC2754896.1 sulfotransferase domain-containing protein [Desulfobacteraceae bacterium]
MFINKIINRKDKSAGQFKKHTIFHLTHYKAGSQWVLAVLKSAVKRRIVKPLPRVKHVTEHSIIAGKVYPCVYLTRDDFFSLNLPEANRSFYIIRDLRDTLISQYFSIRYSHPILHENMQKARERMASMETREGLLSMMTKRWPSAEIQRSWAQTDDMLTIRYEDLRADQFSCFKQIFNHCGFATTDRKLKKIIKAHSFEKKTGRKPGQEDLMSHHRKGIVGDWENYFDERLKIKFKEQFGQILIKTGYEKDLDW